MLSKLFGGSDVPKSGDKYKPLQTHSLDKYKKKGKPNDENSLRKRKAEHQIFLNGINRQQEEDYNRMRKNFDPNSAECSQGIPHESKKNVTTLFSDKRLILAATGIALSILLYKNYPRSSTDQDLRFMYNAGQLDGFNTQGYGSDFFEEYFSGDLEKDTIIFEENDFE